MHLKQSCKMSFQTFTAQIVVLEHYLKPCKVLLTDLIWKYNNYIFMSFSPNSSLVEWLSKPSNGVIYFTLIISCFIEIKICKFEYNVLYFIILTPWTVVDFNLPRKSFHSTHPVKEIKSVICLFLILFYKDVSLRFSKWKFLSIPVSILFQNKNNKLNWNIICPFHFHLMLLCLNIVVWERGGSGVDGTVLGGMWWKEV